mgnify:CR=1 FL=1
MRLKKALALALATTLTLSSSSIAAFATDTPTDPDSKVEGTITGADTYINTTKYVVTLPTATGFGFNLDPTGVYGYFQENGDSATPSLNDLSGKAGAIVGVDNNSVINMSSVPIVLECDFKLSSNISGVQFLATDDTIDDDKNDIWFNVYAGTVDTSNKYTASTTDYATISGDATGTKVLFALDAADYVFKKTGNTYSYDRTDASQTAAYFSLGGKMSKNGDWSQLETDGTVTLSCVYSFKGLKSLPTDSADISTTTGFILNADSLEYLEEAETLAYTFTYSKGAANNITQDLGFTPTTIAVTNSSGTACNIPLTAQHVTLSGTTLTILSSWLSTCPNGTYVITLSDNVPDNTITKTISITIE